jgi:hypothetical protein
VIVVFAEGAGLPMPIIGACAATGVFVFRVIAMLRHWTAPGAITWRARPR